MKIGNQTVTQFFLSNTLGFFSVNPPGSYLAVAVLFLIGFLSGWWTFEQMEIF